MPRHRFCLAVLGTVLLVPPGGSAPPADGAGFRPVAPAAALQAALEGNFKITRDWLGDKDFVSAADSVQGLVALAELYRYHGTQPGWRERTVRLREAFAQLGSAARAKDAAGCDRAARLVTEVLNDLAKAPPEGAPAAAPDFQPPGNTRVWMMLMDGGYADAKAAESVKELKQLALAVAEEANVAEHLRPEAKWRQFARETRDAALGVARRAQDNDLAAARGELKKVYQRCEACHQGYKR